MLQKRSTRSFGYTIGDLSNFPQEIDTLDNLFSASNNAITELASALNTSQSICVLKDASRFPNSGVVRVDDELIYFSYREGNTLYDLHRSFAGTGSVPHKTGSRVIAPFAADMHNSIRDAIIKTQVKVGLPNDAENIGEDATLWSIASFLRRKWLTPKSFFFSHNRIGKAPLGVQFQDFSYGEPIRWIWEFGDGSISNEQHPYHVYSLPGSYSVSLTIFSNVGTGVSFRSKKDYVQVIDDEALSEVIFYAETLDTNGIYQPSFFSSSPATVRFTDQSPGNISTRIWSFGDGTQESVDDPDQYQVTHVYESPGTYAPSLIVTDGISTIQKNLDRNIEVGVV